MWLFERSKRKRVPRDLDNLPSLVMTPVPTHFSYRSLADQVAAQALDKQLVCLIEFGWDTTNERALRDIEDLYEFSDDASLVLLEYTREARFIIRASFMHATTSLVSADSFIGIRDELRLAAKARKLATMAIDRP